MNEHVPWQSDDDIDTAAKELVDAADTAQSREKSSSKTATESTKEWKDWDFDWIGDRVKEAKLPDPKMVEDVAAALRLAYGGKMLDSGEVGAVDGLTEIIGPNKDQWWGASAKNFEKYYVRPFNDCRKNQINAVGEIEAAMLTWYDILKARRNDYVKLANKIRDSLEVMDDCGFSEVSSGLMVASAVIAVGAAIPTGGASLSIWAVAGAVNTSLIAGTTVAKAVDGTSVQQVVDAANAAFKQIDEVVDDMASDLADKLKTSSDEAASQIKYDKDDANLPALLPNEPEVKDGPPQVTDGKGSNLHGDFEIS